MCVIGGGVIGCEMAQAFARLGVHVTLIANRLLPKEPPTVDAVLAKQFAEDGIAIVRGHGSAVERCAAGAKLTVAMADGSTRHVEAELLLVAAGRRPKTSTMNLEAAGVDVDTKTRLICVSKSLQTSASHIYAAGDCCTLQQFTHYAALMGGLAIRNALFPLSETPTEVIPRVTFTTPEVASVGLSEAEARERGCDIYSQPSDKNERAICESDVHGFMDVYVDKSGKIVGACLVNNRAGELLSELCVAIRNKIPFQNLGLSSVVHAYPTYSWSLSMLASDVYFDRFSKSASAKIAKFITRH